MKERNNCPNCGAPLSRDGTCEYCGTKVVRPNNIYTALSNGCYTNLTLNIEDENGNIFVFPMTGRIENVNMSTETINAVDYIGHTIKSFRTGTNIDFNFSGRLEVTQ